MDQIPNQVISEGEGVEIVAQSLAELLMRFASVIKKMRKMEEFDYQNMGNVLKERAKKWKDVVDKEIERGNVLQEYIQDVLDEQRKLILTNSGSNISAVRRRFATKLEKEFNPLQKNFKTSSTKLKELNDMILLELGMRMEDELTYESVSHENQPLLGSDRNTTIASTSVRPHARSNIEEIPQFIDATSQEFELDSDIPKLQQHYPTPLSFDDEDDEEFKDLQQNAEELSYIFNDLSKHIQVQQEQLQEVETNITNAQQHTNDAVRELSIAAKLKTYSLPVIGAAIGAVAGGPVGASLGMKSALAVTTCTGIGAGLGMAISKTMARGYRSVISLVSNDPQEDEGTFSTELTSQKEQEQHGDL